MPCEVVPCPLKEKGVAGVHHDGLSAQVIVAAAHAEGGDNLIADLVEAQQAGAEITDHEIASLCYSLLFAGHETTTTLIANSIRVLLSHRDQWDAIIADPKLITKAIDEVLRYSGSIVAWRRKALKDTQIGGVDISGSTDLFDTAPTWRRIG